MQLHQLVKVFEQIKNYSEQGKMLTKYQKIIELCQQLAKDVNNEKIKNNLFSIKNELIEIHQHIEPLLWLDSNFNCLHTARNQGLFGQDFIAKVNSIISFNNTYYQRIADEFVLILKQTEQWIKSSEDFINNSKNWESIIPEFLNSTQETSFIKIFFTQSTSVRSITDLERNIRIWNGIFNSLAILTKHVPTDLLVYALEQGNMVVKAPHKITEAFSSAIIEILKTYRKILEIRKLKDELTLLNLNSSEEIEKILEQETKIQIEQIASEITQNLIGEYNPTFLNDDDSFEVLSKAIKQMMNFIEKGGKIDLDTNGFEALKEKHEQIILNYSKIFELEKCVKSMNTFAQSKEIGMTNLVD